MVCSLRLYSASAASRQIDAELLELAVQMGALQAGLLGHARHGAVFLGEVELEIRFLEPSRASRSGLSRSKLCVRLRAQVDHRRQRSAAGHQRAVATVVDHRQRSCWPAARRWPRAARAFARQALLDRLQQLLQRDRFFEERERADLVASTAVSMVAWPLIMITGMVSRPAGRPLLEQRDAVGVGHPDVEQHQVGPGALPRGAGLRCVLGEFDVVAFVIENFRRAGRGCPARRRPPGCLP